MFGHGACRTQTREQRGNKGAHSPSPQRPDVGGASCQDFRMCLRDHVFWYKCVHGVGGRPPKVHFLER